jgi:phenylacetate-CoA ligase
MDAEKLYLKLPVGLQNLALSVEGRRIHRRRYNAEFSALLKEYEERARWSAEETNRFRDRRLAEFVERASLGIAHYRELFDRLGIAPADIRGLADLQSLPILTKREIQRDPARFQSDDSAVAPTLQVHTSGSTGAGLRFPATWRAHREQWAVWWRYRGWHGLSPDTTCLYFGGRSIVPVEQDRPPFWRHNRGGHQIMFSAYHLKDETAPAYLEQMRQSGAPWIHGYPSMVALIASYALEHGVEIKARWVTLGSENLLPQQEQLIERAFGVLPIEHYGMAEAVANISMCPARRLHVDEDFAATEFIPVEDGRHKIIGTNLSNPAFPLLRYEVGDFAAIGGLTCDCGRPGRVVERLDGRLEDYVIAKDGAKLGRLDHIFKDLDRVREAQIHQARVGHMVMSVVKGPGYSDQDDRLLREEIVKRVGDRIDFDIEYVTAVRRTGSEKLRFVISTLEHGKVVNRSTPRGTP